ncbi:MAG: hypothetical protein EOP42_08185 [Sphingobacteriaceae bacterium]|nr:MAG: hypothetical protein EOP42_08185 [Sphingobacteriaceae bacterium]
MKTKLTPRLLGFLIKKGYKYFLSQTTCIDQEDAYVSITLKPVKKHPLLQNLPEPFSAYCSIFQDPAQMALGIFNTKIVVDLEIKDMKNFENATKSDLTVSYF